MNTELMERLAQTAAGKFGWSAGTSRADVAQEAWLAMLEAAPHFDPSKGVEEGTYLWRCVINAVGQHTSKTRSPVSAGERRLHKLPPPTILDAVPELPVQDAPDEQVDTTRWAIRWVTRVEQILDEVEGQVPRSVVRAVIVEEETPAQVARRHGLEVEQVYNLVRGVRRHKLAKDPILQALQAQLTG